MFHQNQEVIDSVMASARAKGLVSGLVGGEMRGYITPDGQYIDVAGWKSHTYLAKILGYSGIEELLQAGLVRLANSKYDMQYEFCDGNEAGIAYVNASISWNIGMDIWPKKAKIALIIIGLGTFDITAEDFVNADCDIKKAILPRGESL